MYEWFPVIGIIGIVIGIVGIIYKNLPLFVIGGVLSFGCILVLATISASNKCFRWDG